MAKASVIISVYKNVAALRAVLYALDCQTEQDFEIIVSEDGQYAPISECVTQWKESHTTKCLIHLTQVDVGWRKNIALNRAVAASSTDYLLFLDGDCVPEKHWVEEHLAFRCAHEVITGRRVLLSPKATQMVLSNPHSVNAPAGLFFLLLVERLRGYKSRMENMLHIRTHWIRNCFIHDRERFILGCNFSMHKSDLLTVAGFDERFVYPGLGEDIDLGNRLRRAGIYARSRRAALIVYHCYHPRLDTSSPENRKLMEENIQKNIIRWNE